MTRLDRSCILLAAIVVTGCEEPVIPEVTVGVAPGGNGHVVLEQQYAYTSNIWEMVPDANGGFYFNGFMTNERAFGRLERDGSKLWTRRPYFAGGIVRIPKGAGFLKDAIVVVGQQSSTPDAASAWLFDSEGVLIKEQLFPGANGISSFRDVMIDAASPTTTQCVAGGFVMKEGESYPLVVSFVINSADTIRALAKTVLWDEPNALFEHVAVWGDAAPASYYATLSRFDGDNLRDRRIVCGFDESLTIVWRTNIGVPQASRPIISDVAVHDGDLIAVGDVVVDKGGDLWNAAMVASIAPDGTVVGARRVVHSEYSDWYDGCVLYGGKLYAVGSIAVFQFTDRDRVFGLGAVAWFDPVSLRRIGRITIGSAEYRSGLRAVAVTGTRMSAGGYTLYEQPDRPYRGWFVELDLLDHVDR